MTPLEFLWPGSGFGSHLKSVLLLAYSGSSPDWFLFLYKTIYRCLTLILHLKTNKQTRQQNLCLDLTAFSEFSNTEELRALKRIIIYLVG